MNKTRRSNITSVFFDPKQFLAFQIDHITYNNNALEASNDLRFEIN